MFWPLRVGFAEVENHSVLSSVEAHGSAASTQADGAAKRKDHVRKRLTISEIIQHSLFAVDSCRVRFV